MSKGMRMGRARNVLGDKSGQQWARIKIRKTVTTMEPTCQCRKCGFDPWVRKIPWSRKWQPTPEFLPEEVHGQRSLEGYSPWGLNRVRHDLATKQQKQREAGRARRIRQGYSVKKCVVCLTIEVILLNWNLVSPLSLSYSSCSSCLSLFLLFSC